MYAILDGYKELTDFSVWLATLPIVLSLATAAFLMLLGNYPKFQARIAISMNGLILILCFLLMQHVERHGVLVVKMGSWPAPFGIIFAVDNFAALFSLFAAIAGLALTAFAVDTSDGSEKRFGFLSLIMLLMAGVHGAFLTGDIFNLYVWFEVMVIASFGLLILGGRHHQLDGAIKYTFLNLLATSFFLVSVGLLYGLTGSLNFADLSLKLADMNNDPILLIIAFLMITAFLMKSAVFPLGMWLPASYHTPKIIVSAIMAGLLTKVGLYALIRTSFVIFPTIFIDYQGLFITLGALTLLIGAIGALAHSDIRRVGAYLVIAGVGTILLGLAMNSPQSLSGALFYATQSILLMSAFFMCIALIRVSGGSYDAHRITSLYRRDPALSILFFMLMLAIAGLPPFSGLWAKMQLIESAVASHSYFALGALLIGSFLIIIALGRLWLHLFWGERLPLAILHRPSKNRLCTYYKKGRPFIYALSLASLSLGFGLFPDVVMKRTDAAVKDIMQMEAYQFRVLHNNGTPLYTPLQTEQPVSSEASSSNPINAGESHE